MHENRARGPGIGDGLRFVWREPTVRALTFLGLGNSFTGGALLGLLVVFAVRDLGLRSTDPRIGWLFASTTLGALLASLTIRPLSNRLRLGRLTLFGLAGAPVCALALSASRSLGAALVAYCLFSWAANLVILNGISTRQLLAPLHMQGRINATARMVAWGGQPFGAVIAGLLADAFGARWGMALSVAGVGLSALIGWFTILRALPMTARSITNEV